MFNLNKEMMRITLGLLFGFLGFWFVLSTCLTIPGQGMQSLKFINSVEDEIDRVTPKGKFILDSKFAMFGLDSNALRTDYEIDALSSIVSDNATEEAKIDGTEASKLKAFADNWFNDYLGSGFEKGNLKDIDLYDVGHNLIEFDKEVARQFHSKSFVNAGTQFLFTNSNAVKQLFSTSLKNDSKLQEKTEEQETYKKSVILHRDGLNQLTLGATSGNNHDDSNSTCWSNCNSVRSSNYFKN